MNVVNVLALSELAAGDPDATRTVYATVAGLAAVGALLVVIAIWLIRQTRPERELLGPLEHMGDRRWRSMSKADRRRALDEVRPIGANPVSPEARVPEIDAEFEQSTPTLANFDDLRVAAPDDDDRVSDSSSGDDSDDDDSNDHNSNDHDSNDHDSDDVDTADDTDDDSSDHDTDDTADTGDDDE